MHLEQHNLHTLPIPCANPLISTVIPPSLFSSLPPVPKWWAINPQYTGKSGRNVTAAVANGKEAFFKSAHFQSADEVAALVSGAITSGKLPADEHGVYAVLGDDATTQVS